MGRQRCKEPFSFIETLRLLLNVLDFNSVYYSRHERHLAKIGTRQYAERYGMHHLLLGFKKKKYRLGG